MYVDFPWQLSSRLEALLDHVHAAVRTIESAADKAGGSKGDEDGQGEKSASLKARSCLYNVYIYVYFIYIYIKPIEIQVVTRTHIHTYILYILIHVRVL